MKKFRVRVNERWASYYDIEADSPEEAIEIVADGGGDEQDRLFEYVDTMDTDTWDVEEIEEND